MKTRNLLLPAFLLAAVLPTGHAFAQQSEPGSAPEGVVMSKYIEEGTAPNTYTLNLEAYVTGESITQQETISAPCDFVLVLDYSGSMDKKYGSGSYQAAKVVSQYTYNDLSKGKTTVDFLGASRTIQVLSVDETAAEKAAHGNPSSSRPANTWAYFDIGATRYYCNADGMIRQAQSNVNPTYWNWPKDLDGEPIYPVQGKGDTKYMWRVMGYETRTVTQRIDALRAAVSSFIDVVRADAVENNVEHRISLVEFQDEKYPKFSGVDWDRNRYTNSGYEGFLREDYDLASTYASNDKQATAVMKRFVKVDSEQAVTALKYSVASAQKGGQTATKTGLELGRLMMTNLARTDVPRILILFTDGVPELNGSGWTDNYSNQVVQEALQIKNEGITVYSIGVFGSEISSANKTKIEKLMNAVSSNYPSAARYDTWGDGSDQGYYRNASSGDLSDIFVQIAHESISGGASIKLDATSTTVIDVVADSFRLPEGSDGSSIRLSVAPCTGSQTIGDRKTFTFGSAVAAKTLFPGITAKVGLFSGNVFTEEAGGKAVQISNYDFSANWVGENTSGSAVTYHGYKLIISFDIEIDPANPGGATENTNTADSGIYYDSDGDGSSDQVGAFEIPVVKIPNLVIIKRGLKKGDSAIFCIYRIGPDGSMSKFPMELVATQGDGEYAMVRAKIQKPGRYMVEESEWSWAYGVTECRSSYERDDANVSVSQWNAAGFGSGSNYQYSIPDVTGTVVSGRTITRNLNDFTEEEKAGEYKGTLFEFTNEPAKGVPAHAEAFKNNVFNERD